MIKDYINSHSLKSIGTPSPEMRGLKKKVKKQLCTPLGK